MKARVRGLVVAAGAAAVVVSALTVARSLLADRAARPAGPAATASRLSDRVMWSLRPGGWPGAVAADEAGAVALFRNHEVLAFDPDDGEVRWRSVLDPRVLGDPPALGDSVVAVLLDDGFLVLDRATGATRWRSDVLADASAVQVGGGVVATATYGGVLRVHDDRSGELRWTRTLAGAATTRPQIDTEARALVEVVEHGAARGASLVALDLDTGVTRWEAALDGGASTPVIAASQVLVGDGDGRIKSFDLARGTPTWSVAAVGAFESGLEPVRAGSTVVVVDRLAGVTAVDASAGRVLWQTDLDDAVVAVRPALGAELVALTTSGGRRVVVLSRVDGRVLFDERPDAVPQGVAWHPRRGGLLLVGLRSTNPGRVEAWRVARP